jgi:alpha-L-rhamnosidase
VHLLIDQSYLTNAYPVLTVSAGKYADIRMSYAEALVDDQGRKGNRDSVLGKKLVGLSDEFISDGAQRRVYRPLFFRTFRYLELTVKTEDEALEILDFHSLFTGYPLAEKASFQSEDPRLDKIWKTGWRTARLCAVDTYFDCPYYEQLQYVGDTRIQSMISLYVAGDPRLMKKAILDISHSFFSEGLTQSRYPSRDMQIIPTFSLWWVCMIHDYWMHCKDVGFIRPLLQEVESVLAWYRARIAGNGMLGSLSWWQFVDWSWPGVDSIRVGGVPPGVSKGGSSIVSLQYAYTLQRASALMAAFGQQRLSGEYAQLANSLINDTYRLCWDSQRKLLADSYEKKEFSQHANVLAVLTDALPPEGQKGLIRRILEAKNITPCTYYFRFYLFEAMKKTGLGDLFLDELGPWEEMLRNGLTTFAENPEPTRSDCHAWSASPVYELLSTVCGIRSVSPGFSRIQIAPSMGALRHIQGKMPHPGGFIELHLERDGDHLHGTVSLPSGTTGVFIWKEKHLPLAGGLQQIDL